MPLRKGGTIPGAASASAVPIIGSWGRSSPIPRDGCPGPVYLFVTVLLLAPLATTILGALIYAGGVRQSRRSWRVIGVGVLLVPWLVFVVVAFVVSLGETS
jgi:hypothetical protein